MQDKNEIFFGNRKYKKLQSCILNTTFFQKLFKEMSNISREGAQIEIENLKKKPNQSQKQFDKMKDNVFKLYKPTIQVFGSKGEYSVALSETIFSETNLPDRITKIIIDNTSQYNLYLNLNPQCFIKIEFDFNKSPIFDLTSNPSFETTNNSYLNIYGPSETWVNGAYDKINALLAERKSKRLWLHKKNIYDIFIWLLIIPITFHNLIKLDRFFHSLLQSFSQILRTAFYIYIFIVLLLFFRIIFDYIRWLYPYLEFESSLKSSNKIQRGIIITLSSLIILPFLKDLIMNIIRLIF